MKLKSITIIALTKKGNIFPIKLFDDWFKCGRWCDMFIQKNKGCDPALYQVNNVRGLKKFVYALFLIFKKL